MNPNLLQKLDGYDYSEYNLKELSQHKDWNNVIKKINPIISEMDTDMLSYCQDKISNSFTILSTSAIGSSPVTK